MNKNLTFFLLALVLISTVISCPAQAGCMPTTSSVACLGSPCDNVGTTVLDKDRRSIIACLLNDSGQAIWKGRHYMCYGA